MDQGTLAAARDEHQVTPLELLFDLTFVFAITQVTILLADIRDPGACGTGLSERRERVRGGVRGAWLLRVSGPDPAPGARILNEACRRLGAGLDGHQKDDHDQRQEQPAGEPDEVA